MEEKEKRIIGEKIDPKSKSLDDVKRKTYIVRAILIAIGALFLVAAILIFIFVR